MPDRSASGERDRLSFLDVMRRIALLKRPLCLLRRAGARDAGVVRQPVVLMARYAGVVCKPVVRFARCVKRDSRCTWFRPNAHCARCDPSCAWFQPNARCAACGSVEVWSAHATGNPKERDRSAEPAHAADRFAREIIGILTVAAVRLRRLMGNPFGVRGT